MTPPAGEVFNISYNLITEIHPDTFKYMTQLKSLYLYDNQITKIHPDTFKSLTQLKKLFLSDNRITEIHPDTFKYMTQLRELDISYNKITEIHPDTFKSLTQLKILSIYDNPITEIIFNYLPTFETRGVKVTVIVPEVKVISLNYECLVCHINHLDKDYEGEKYGIKLSCQNKSDHVVCGECYKRWYVEGKRELKCVLCQEKFKYSECCKCI